MIYLSWRQAQPCLFSIYIALVSSVMPRCLVGTQDRAGPGTSRMASLLRKEGAGATAHLPCQHSRLLTRKDMNKDPGKALKCSTEKPPLQSLRDMHRNLQQSLGELSGLLLPCAFCFHWILSTFHLPSALQSFFQCPGTVPGLTALAGVCDGVEEQ